MTSKKNMLENTWMDTPRMAQTEKTGMNVALLVDGENVSSAYINRIQEIANGYGTIAAQYVYGDYSQGCMKPWDLMCSKLLMERRHVCAMVTGKNAADHKLVIDTMKLIFSGQIDVIAIASSDSDYSEIACEIRRAGIQAIGIGTNGAKQDYREMYDKFFMLDQQVKGEKNLEMIRNFVEEILNIIPDNNGWYLISEIGIQLRKEIKDFDCKSYGEKTLKYLLRKLGYEAREISRGNGKASMIRRKVNMASAA